MIDLSDAKIGSVWMREMMVRPIYSHAKIVAILEANGISEDNASSYTDQYFGEKKFAILFDEVTN